ncbi:hypothetical protein AVEN_100094-1 [Araneus ventricosus]|uniref:RNase H type-1 domain-containing protein n=1 Tax=Araneus ventricosus TaxID=182803 RepID=A0A4Y2J137_ARAVE|nr:hypothetical protein AVEN_100094-1 [Araneus ventricosus]
MSGVKRKRNVLNVKQKLEILQKLYNGESARTDVEDVLNEGIKISHSAALQSVETLLDYMGQRGFDYGDVTMSTWHPRKLNDDSFEVYTGRSKIAGGVGFSVCILKEEIQQKILSCKLNTDNTVFQAELAAAWAVETINKINIFSDSKSSIDALESHRTKSKFVNGIKEKFRSAEGLLCLACRDPRQ